MSGVEYSFWDKAKAWFVHTLTASGVVAAFLSIVAINQERWSDAMWWLIVCLIIDGVDGTFARRFKVKEVLPNFDGQTVDNIIDFATYAIIPAFFMYAAKLPNGELLLPGEEWVRMATMAAVLLVSAFYYGKSGMVSDDLHFVGFPVMWNLVAFYLYFVLACTPWVNVVLILILCVLHFVPIKFPYPSRTVGFFYPTLIVTIVLVLANLIILALFPERNEILSWVAILALTYFGLMGLYKTFFYKQN